MSGEDLSSGGHAGLFGKLPATGDFVTRGLPDAFRARWDGWMTRNLAPRPACWPRGGLRFRLASACRGAAGLVLPSHDAAGRRFPLSVLVMLPFPPAPEAAEAWCDAALPLATAAREGGLTADALWADLDALPRPAQAGPSTPALLLWAKGDAPLAADPSDPEDALSLLFSSGESWTP